MNQATFPLKSPAVRHAAAILRFLATAARPCSLAAVARAVSVSPSSCLNILRTLVAEDLVAFHEDEKTYALGSGIITLARRALDPENALSLAWEPLRALAREHGTTAALWRVTEGDKITLLGFENSGLDTRLHMTVGWRLPLLSGAVGRSIAAASDDLRPRLEMLFNRVRWEEPPSLADYVREADVARERGWSLDRGQFRRGVTTIAACVQTNPKGRSSLAVSASLLGLHYTTHALDQVGHSLLKATRRIAQLQGESAL